jgi:hypothetical protein
VVVVAIMAAAPGALAQERLSVGPLAAAPGTTASGEIAVPALGADRGTTIPITLVNGSRPGPVLALVAGVHGMEYAPILALQRLRDRLDPSQLRGALILVHVANVPSFLGRTIYYSPVDGKNLNRVFPGRRDGTVSERIADLITREVIERSTHVIDVHCGDGNESLRPYSYWMTTAAPEVNEASRRLVLAFGLDHIVIDRERPADPAASVYLSNTASLRGRPAITVESGALADTDEASIARIERGVRGVMRELGMAPEGPPAVEHPVWIDRSEVLRAKTTGILYPQVERGTTVAAGALLAHVTDFAGTRLEEIRAPFDGEVLYVVATPPITAGEPVAFIGQRAAGPTP